MSVTPVKIGLWGAPGSGKTAFLGALAIAVDMSGDTTDGEPGRPRSPVGSWSIWGSDNESVDYLFTRKKEMMHERTFPPPTNVATKPLSWGFAGDLARSEFDRRPKLLQHKELLSNFQLDLIDMPGAIYDTSPGKAEEADSAAAAAFEHMVQAQGLIYLFDPVTEREYHDAIKYVDGTIEELKSRVYKNTGKLTRYLDYELSVCITKFDHRKIYPQARKLHYVFDDPNDPNGMPMVADKDARRLFDAICSGDFWPERYEEDTERARLVRRRLTNAFDPDRIRYYVTSAIGFVEKDLSASFDGDKFQPNYRDGESKILGDVRPINVLEPLIRMQQRIIRQRRR